MPVEVFESLREAALRSPSSRNINPWEFVFVTDREMLIALSHAKKDGSSFLSGAAMGVVVCADARASDVWVEDCSIASIILQLTAQSFGLGSCWIQIRNRMHQDGVTSEAYIRGVLHLPEYIAVESIISIGYPAKAAKPHPKSSLVYHKLHLNSW